MFRLARFISCGKHDKTCLSKAAFAEQHKHFDKRTWICQRLPSTFSHVKRTKFNEIYYSDLYSHCEFVYTLQTKPVFHILLKLVGPFRFEEILMASLITCCKWKENSTICYSQCPSNVVMDCRACSGVTKSDSSKKYFLLVFLLYLQKTCFLSNSKSRSLVTRDWICSCSCHPQAPKIG